MKKLLLIPLLIVGCEELLVSKKEGCTTATACNYDSTATKDDGSCLENDCVGECGGSATVDDCDVCDSENPNQCDVAWMIAMKREYVSILDTTFFSHEYPILYWTDGYEPYSDTIIYFGSYGISCFYPAIVNQDTLCIADSVSSIYHFVEPNYFKVLYDSDSLIIYPYEHEEVFKYEYK